MEAGAVDEVVVVAAGLEVVVAGLVALVVGTAGVSMVRGEAVGLWAKATEPVAQRTANVLNRCVGLIEGRFC